MEPRFEGDSSVKANELPLDIKQAELKAKGGDSEIWKVLAKDQKGQEKLVALKETQRQDFATEGAMKESKEFYDFLKTFPGFGRFVPDTLYFKARPSSGEEPRAYALQKFLGGTSIDRIADEELYKDPEVVRQLIEFGANAIALLREARAEKRLRPDFTKSFDDNRYANIVGNYLFNPRRSNNIMVSEKPDENGQRVFFVDTGANAEDRLDKTRAVVQREVATRLQELQLRRWINKLQKNLEASNREHSEAPTGERETAIGALRESILADQESKQENIDVARTLRLSRRLPTDPVAIPQADRTLVDGVASEGEERLDKNYEPGFGVFPSADPDENFYQQLWTRDLAHAGGNYLATQRPKALKDSLETVFSHQRADGMLPLRTEKQYMLLKIVPGLRKLAKPVFEFIEGTVRGRKERPVYEGQDFSSAEDTVPAALIAVGEFFISSPDGRKFAEEHFDELKRAVDFFRAKTDPSDGLAVAKHMNADWADSINRGGKLGEINVWWARSLRLMELMAAKLGKNEEAAAYRKEFHHVEANMMEKIYDKEGAYFRTAEGEDRVDTVASIFGSLYFLNPKECVRVQETLVQRMRTLSGLKNFDPPYPASQIMWPHKLIGHQDYHNKDIWPWVTCENIQVKIKIATQHPDEAVRNRFKQEAIDDLRDMADLFEKAGGAYEIFRPNDRKPAIKRFYKPPQNLMGNLAAYEGAYLQMKELGWLNKPSGTGKTTE